MADRRLYIRALNLLEHSSRSFDRDLAVGRRQLFREHPADFVSSMAVTISNKILMESEEDKRARKILETTTKRVKNGFETGLLWKYDYIEFPESYQMALSRLKCLEKKLQADPKLYTKINNQIEECQIKEYAHKATENELKLADPRRVWYLPLGIVINPKKPNKVRLIWDAAAQVDGISFNSMLLKGPDQVAICGDIREMFHQIKIRDEDKQSQRFLWREDSSKEPEVYIIDVATFGSTCSPCSPQYVKNLNAKENVLEHPKAASVILENHYVDDYLDSLNTAEETIKLAEEVKIVHKKGGFEIRNWLSNSTEVFQKIGETDLKNIKKFNDNQTERVLGMIWLPESDVFIFSTMIKEEIRPFMYGDVKPTKRQILKCVMSMFDPLGLLTFYTIHGKILIQDIWRTSIKWDDEIPHNLYERWSRWSKLFSQIHDIQIPRCYFDGCSTDCFKSVQLHVFVDASESAYACIAYFRIIDNGKPRCVLVSAKAKVAPLKPISIPRLELQAAVIGTRLMKTICSNHNYKITKRFLYTDSSTVLQWIRSDARKYRQFVALRIGEILTETDINEWNWVPTKINVADEATKWGKGPCFDPNCRWFNGPEFLYQAEENWPKQNISFDNTKEELRVSNFHQEVKNEKIIEFDNFSKWERLVKTTCFIFRFIESCRAKSNKSKNTDCMKQEELTKSENILFRMAQNEVYQKEMLILNENKSHQRKILDKTSSIYKLSPFIDEFGVLRIEGRIDTAPNVSYEAKYPIILPKRHKITALLVNWYHRKFYHCNHETVVNEVRQKLYISNLRTIVKNVIRQCQWCINYKANPTTPRMAPLPKSRLMSFVRPFTYVDLDYFGPILIKIKRSNDKRWIAIFTCLTIRAIHMEVVNSLSTEACIMAIRRFIARRGPPLEIYTDNGTNFQGASKQLNAELKEINKSISETFTSSHTKWIFNPPAAPHMGGAWERMVRSVKVAMKTMVTKKTLDEETLKTIITEAESLINSRPLTYIPIEPDNQEALTPNHFFLGSSNGIRQHIEKDVTKNYNLRSSWHLIQDSMDQFWNRWIKECLPMITRRTKWFTDTKPIETGDIVLIVDCKIKNQWTRGRVVRVIEGQDGRIRQAIVKVGNKFLRRPTTKLAVLDLQDNSKTEFKNQSYEGKNVTADSFEN